MQAEGYGGQLRAGSRVALRLGAWRLEEDGFDSIVHAETLTTDLYFVTQPPFNLVLNLGNRLWRWPVAKFDGEGITVTGSPQENI